MWPDCPPRALWHWLSIPAPISTVSRTVLSAGDALGLPVLQVPADTPFIAITRAVIDELTADQLRSVQRVVDQQEVFARAGPTGRHTGCGGLT
jgi:hypothetical protein